jgi:predicted dehydrogenase
MIRILLAGYGVRGRQWAAAIGRNPDVELSAIADPNDAAVRDLSMPVFRQLGEALESVPADAVLLATPPSVHADDVRTAVRRGLPVLCEKPLTEDVEEAIALVGDVSRLGGTLLVGMNFRFLPVTQELRRMVRTRELGGAMFGQFTYIRNRDGRRPDLNDFPLTMAQPMLLEQSIHHLDLLRYVYDREVISVAADTWNPSTSVYDDDSCVAALLRFEGGLHVSYLGTWTSGTNRFDFRWRTDFEDGVIVQAEQFGSLLRARLVPGGALSGRSFDTDSEPPQPLPIQASAPFVVDTENLLAHFARVVEGTEEPGPTGQDHLITLVLLDACAESSTTGMYVDTGERARARGISLPFKETNDARSSRLEI